MLAAMRNGADPTAGEHMPGQAPGGGDHHSKHVPAADRRTPKLGTTPNWLHDEGDIGRRGAAQPPRVAGDCGTNAGAAAATALSEQNRAKETRSGAKPGKALHSKAAKRRVKNDLPAAAEAIPQYTPKQDKRVGPLSHSLPTCDVLKSSSCHCFRLNCQISGTSSTCPAALWPTDVPEDAHTKQLHVFSSSTRV